MKTITKNFKISTVLLLAVFLLFSLDSYSSHWRFGQLTWKPKPSISPTTAEFSFTAAFRWSGYSNPPVGAIISETVGGTGLQFGDGGYTGILYFKVVAIDPANDWFIGYALDPSDHTKTTIEHTYSAATNGGSPWEAIISSCCRTGSEINNRGGNYRISTFVELVTGNRSPVSSLPAIVNMSQSATASFLVPASDPDPNTVLTYRLASSSEAGPGFNQPTAGGFALSIDASTGLVSWNTTAAVLGGLYSTQIIIEDRDASTNAIRTTIAIDFLIQIVDCDPGNTAPVFLGSCGSTLTVTAGENLTFTVEAEDSDIGDNVILNTGGVPTGATMTPSLPVSGLNSTSSTFSWNTTLADGGNNYVVSFSASDDCGVQTLCSYTISVVACSIEATAVTSDISCSGNSDGEIDLTVSGNYGNATFEWTGPDGFTATAEDLTGLAVGSYTVEVSGDLGCSVTETFEVGTTPDETDPEITCAGPVTINNTPGLCSGTTTLEEPTVTDNCYPIVSGPELVTNGSFSSFGTAWNNCGNLVEAGGGENLYGGTNASNRVAEIDHQPVSLCQNVNGFVIGKTYKLRLLASRRIPSPSTVGAIIAIDGGALSETVLRSNTVFNLTSETFTFVATQTSHQLTLLPSAGWGGTYGLIVDDISITEQITVYPTIASNAPETYPLGETIVTWTATDAAGNDATCEQIVTVVDNEDPVLTVVGVPIVLWPPNHKYVTIDMSQMFESVEDNCGELSIADVFITSVTSDEAENDIGVGDGNTVNDIVINSDCNSVDLRSERRGTENGRVYTIYLAVDDGNGNTGTASFQVTVPHNVGETAIDDGMAYEVECGEKSSFIAVASEDIELKNYPNPFKANTTIEFSLVESNYTKLVVYNSLGIAVATLYDGMAEAEQVYKVEFNAIDLSGGVYFYHLQSGENVNVMKKMMLIK